MGFRARLRCRQLIGKNLPSGCSKTREATRMGASRCSGHVRIEVARLPALCSRPEETELTVQVRVCNKRGGQVESKGYNHYLALEGGKWREAHETQFDKVK